LKKQKASVMSGCRGENLYARFGRLRSIVKEGTMSTDQWLQVSRVLDFILAQKKELGMLSNKEGPPKRKAKKPKEEQVEQLRLF
jgi:hypothetical protein